MLHDICTVTYTADDLDAARAFYTAVTGIEPYYVTPFYLEYRLGQNETELGILRRDLLPTIGGAHANTVGGAIAYWAVDDVEATLERLVELGASVHQPPKDYGERFVGASVVDPFGNVLAIMANPHYRSLHV